MVFAKKPKNVRLVVVSPTYSDPAVYDADSVKFEFGWSRSDIGIDVTIHNNTNSRIYVEWENTRLDDEPICFGNDNSFTYRDTKPDEVIHKGSYSKKFVAKKRQFEIETLRLFYWQTFKEYGESARCPLIIPIRFGDKVVDFSFELQVISDKE